MAIRKILCACGTGVGTSLLVQMNMEEVLQELGHEDVEVEHTVVSDVRPGMADLYVVGRDLEAFVDKVGPEHVVVLTNIVDKGELKEKLQAKFDAE